MPKVISKEEIENVPQLIIAVGNGAGVRLPKRYIGHKANVKILKDKQTKLTEVDKHGTGKNSKVEQRRNKGNARKKV